MNTNQLLRVGRMIAQAHALEEKARKLRNKVRLHNQGHGYYTSVAHYGDGSVNLTLALTEYLQTFPEGDNPSLETFNNESGTYGRLHYKPVLVGEFAPGKRLLVDAWSDKFVMPQQKQEVTT